MTPLNATLDAEIMVSAVISRTEIPAFAVAALEPGEVLETEPQVGSQTIVRLTIGTTTIALASIARVEDRLIATIIEIKRPDLSGPKDDSWKVRKPNPPTG
jgi:flagellar motor switch/type III secretory pathway protein FliN